MAHRDGLREAKTFATAIEPARQLIEARPAIVADAHAAGLASCRTRSGRGRARRGRTQAGRADMRRFVDYRVTAFTDTPTCSRASSPW